MELFEMVRRDEEEHRKALENQAKNLVTERQILPDDDVEIQANFFFEQPHTVRRKRLEYQSKMQQQQMHHNRVEEQVYERERRKKTPRTQLLPGEEDQPQRKRRRSDGMTSKTAYPVPCRPAGATFYSTLKPVLLEVEVFGPETVSTEIV